MPYYLFSTEGRRKGFPARCDLLSRLKTNDGREAVLVKCENIIPDYALDTFLLVARAASGAFSEQQLNDLVTVHIVDPGGLSFDPTVELAGKTPIDWGGFTSNPKIVERWAMV